VKVMRGQLRRQWDLAAETQTFHQHVVPTRGTIRREAHNFRQPSILQPDSVASATRSLILAYDHKRATARRMANAISKRMTSAGPMDDLEAVHVAGASAAPAIFGQNSPNEFGFTRSTCASWVGNDPHLFPCLYTQVMPPIELSKSFGRAIRIHTRDDRQATAPSFSHSSPFLRPPMKIRSRKLTCCIGSFAVSSTCRGGHELAATGEGSRSGPHATASRPGDCGIPGGWRGQTISSALLNGQERGTVSQPPAPGRSSRRCAGLNLS
jgi:hypothetical protein